MYLGCVSLTIYTRLYRPVKESCICSSSTEPSFSVLSTTSWVLSSVAPKIFRWMTGQMCFFLNFGMNCPLFKTFRFYKQKCWLTTSIFQERDLWISSNGMGIVTWFLYGYSFDSPNSSTAYDYPVPAPCFPAFAGGQPQPSPPSTANPRSSTRAKQESRAELQVSVAVL